MQNKSKDKRSDHKLIPSGKLREPISNLTKADLIIITKSNIHAPSNYLINKIYIENGASLPSSKLERESDERRLHPFDHFSYIP